MIEELKVKVSQLEDQLEIKTSEFDVLQRKFDQYKDEVNNKELTRLLDKNVNTMGRSPVEQKISDENISKLTNQVKNLEREVQSS